MYTRLLQVGVGFFPVISRVGGETAVGVSAM